jgi:Ca2+ transporting ATPase
MGIGVTCSITIGKAVAIVTETGQHTAIGEIHASISATDDGKTPLKIALDEFGDQLSKIITVICILVWLININHFSDAAFDGMLVLFKAQETG